ncbi:OprO/OprP family phosphate-selective porin [Aliikangiella sp. G2MR2-5]|uniref:OprO/OprP family phosphate-selective porin n=1 Tax=Aliikangiella sp. G2MR2-5 TaxID=2788943 RepID=UPI001AED2461|nr:porin [Aliikangiella sp. G2MR2-5]
MNFYRQLIILFMVSSCAPFITYASEKRQPDFDINGYAMLDYDQFDPAFLEDSYNESDEAELRRLRIATKYKFSKNWESKIQLSYDDKKFDFKDVYLKYSGWNLATVTVGQQKEPFGLEKLISSRNLLMIERSLSTEAFSPGRTPGISFSGDTQNWDWKLGYYIEDNEANAITGRASWSPLKKEDTLLHLGFAFSKRNSNSTEYRINEKLEIHTSDSLLEGDTIIADSKSLTGFETLFMKNSFLLMTEWQRSEVVDIASQKFTYDGGYLQLGYLFGGTSRKYKNGVLKGLDESNQNGNWEVALRASELRLLEESKSAQTLSFGINYYWNKDIKFMFNYIKASHYEDDFEQDSGKAISLRAQYSF